MENRVIGKVWLDLQGYDSAEVYSDGAVEDEMLLLAKDADPDRITSVLNTTDSWPVFYHFSPMRENILSWYPFRENAAVLEIGAGCGAVTGALTGRGLRVTANDLSLKRCEINAWRHRDCENLTIAVSNFERLAAGRKEAYDYVTLIGVLEYAASYIHTEDPYADLLEMADGLLRPDGRMLIAIENRFGAKYFAGCAEDHLGTYFSGIAGYVPEDGVRTLNRQEWEMLLHRCGFGQYRFYYPYPDYKFPHAIYSDEKLPGRGELTRNGAAMDRERYALFDESRFWDSLADTRYFRDFSNSFFIEIMKRGQAWT